MTKHNRSKSKGAASKKTASAALDFSLAKERAKLLEPGHDSLEVLFGTKMNFLDLELVIDEFWRRNLEGRKRLGLRPNQDIRLAECPEGMSDAEFTKLTYAIDAASVGYLECLALMWGHSLNFDKDAESYRELNSLRPKAVQAKRPKKAKHKLSKKK